ncbi:MAG: SIR2 family protein, partial [Thermoleophilaceae bacterium]
MKRLKAPHAERLAAQLKHRNLEQALSRLRRIAALLHGKEKVDGLTAEDAAEFDCLICQGIVAELGLEKAHLEPMLRLAAWAGGADYDWPLEIFTVNYDLLLETALERMRVPYFDGFVGNLAARFHSELVEATPADERWLPASFVRLWKLHGSVNWAWGEETGTSSVWRLGAPVTDGEPAAIYPSDAKYDQSRRVPFLVLHDRLRRALNQPETLLIVSGYAFGDQDLNELLFEAARRRPRSEILAFCHSGLPSELADQAEITPNLQALGAEEAILGGVRRPWRSPGSDTADDVWHDGRFGMRDFGFLAKYLAR